MCKNYHLSIIFLGKPWVFHSYASLSQGNIEIIESFTKLKQQGPTILGYPNPPSGTKVQPPRSVVTNRSHPASLNNLSRWSPGRHENTNLAKEKTCLDMFRRFKYVLKSKSRTMTHDDNYDFRHEVWLRNTGRKPSKQHWLGSTHAKQCASQVMEEKQHKTSWHFDHCLIFLKSNT